MQNFLSSNFLELFHVSNIKIFIFMDTGIEALSKYYIQNGVERSLDIATSSSCNLLQLDHNLILNIFLYLPVTKLCQVCTVSRSFHDICYAVVDPMLTLLSAKHKWIEKLLKDAQRVAWNPLRMMHILTSPHIILIGGNLEPNKVRIIDVRNQHRWFSLADTIVGREIFFESLWYRGQVYVFCGIHHGSYGQVERFNPISNRWSNCPPLPGRLAGVVGCVLKGKLYVTGGYDWHRSEFSSAVYCTDDACLLGDDSSSNCWSLLAARLSFGRSSHACAAYRGKIWVAGGSGEGQSSEGNQSVEIYDPSLGFWYTGPDLNVKRFRLRLFVVRDELYAVGGDRDDRGRKVIPTIEKLVPDKATHGNFKPNTFHWIHVTIFRDNRRGFLSAVVGNKIYVVGGRCGDIPVNNWDAFDVRTGKWISSDDVSSNSSSSIQNKEPKIHNPSSREQESIQSLINSSRLIFNSKGIVGSRGATIPGCAMRW
jgi:hypothetical protein